MRPAQNLHKPIGTGRELPFSPHHRASSQRAGDQAIGPTKADRAIRIRGACPLTWTELDLCAEDLGLLHRWPKARRLTQLLPAITM